MSEFVSVASTAELAPGEMKRVLVDRRRILLANLDGSFYALEDNCGHQNANDDIRTIARRLAGEGYVALVPELYGPGRRRACVTRAVRDLRRGGHTDEALAALAE